MRELPVTAEVERQRLFPLLVRGFEREAPAAAGGVDGNIDAADTGERAFRDALRRLVGEEILLDDDDRRVRFALQLFEQCAPAGDDREFYALPAKGKRDGAADADARAGDQRALAGDGEIHLSA